jgi:hypothetical protein
MRTARRQLVRTPSGYERTKEMFRIPNTEKARQIKANSRTVLATVVFLVLLGAAMLFIAIAGHV